MEQSQKERVAGNEAAFRSINETLSARGADPDSSGATFGLACECGDATCADVIEVPPEVYAATRRDSRKFLIVPGHEILETEDVVERADAYSVVMKHRDVRHVVESTESGARYR